MVQMQVLGAGDFLHKSYEPVVLLRLGGDFADIDGARRDIHWVAVQVHEQLRGHHARVVQQPQLRGVDRFEVVAAAEGKSGEAFVDDGHSREVVDDL